MIYRSDITTRDGTNREGGVYITVKTDAGGLATIFDRDGNPLRQAPLPDRQVSVFQSARSYHRHEHYR
jgi:hypothetical protein